MISGIIFDFDGLILETEEPIFMSYQELYKQYGRQLTLEDWAHVIGLSPEESNPLDELDRLVGNPFRRREAELFLAERQRALLEEQKVMPGIPAYLDSARKMGLKTAIASSSSHSWVDEHLERLGLEEYFDTVCCSDDVNYAKPDPELYHLALERLELTPREAFVLEDSPNGILAARRAGLFCVAVPTPLTGQLSLEKADMIMGSLAETSLADLIHQVENHGR